jgi:succinate dehydrogenase cytochrome b subunit
VSANKSAVIPKAFVLRRVHSLLGLMIIVYLIEHLIVNSQAALWVGDDGAGFIKLVNLIHNLPFLQVIEITLIGVPILFHGMLGVKYALNAKNNTVSIKKDKPALPYGRNIAFNWQRLTSWFLIVGILVHVIQMRFVESPKRVDFKSSSQYMVKLNFDQGLYFLADRLKLTILNKDKIDSMYANLDKTKKITSQISPKAVPYDATIEKEITKYQSNYHVDKLIEKLHSYKLSKTQVVVISSNIGTAFLLMVRDVFKKPFWLIFYTIFVIAAVFHAFNGLWTALITWGVILSYRSQKMMVNFAILLMILLGFLGLMSIWGTYLINLRS